MSQITVEVMDDNQSEWNDWLHMYALEHIKRHTHWKLRAGDALQCVDGTVARVISSFVQDGYKYIVISNHKLNESQLKRKFTTHVHSLNIPDALWHLKQAWNIN